MSRDNSRRSNLSRSNSCKSNLSRDNSSRGNSSRGSSCKDNLSRDNSRAVAAQAKVIEQVQLGARATIAKKKKLKQEYNRAGKTQARATQAKVT